MATTTREARLTEYALLHGLDIVISNLGDAVHGEELLGDVFGELDLDEFSLELTNALYNELGFNGVEDDDPEYQRVGLRAELVAARICFRLAERSTELRSLGDYFVRLAESHVAEGWLGGREGSGDA